MPLQVLILTGSLSGNGKISRWRDSAMQGFSNARDAFLEISVKDALEEYVCKWYQPDAEVERRWWMF